MYESEPDSETVLAQFNRLIQELLRGNMHRNTFRPWEIELLLDIEGCSLREAHKRDTLRRKVLRCILPRSNSWIRRLNCARTVSLSGRDSYITNYYRQLF